jgi:leader peptidase (prepilin peptidase) / N-methyltransferase
MTLLLTFQDYPAFLMIASALLGLVIGSFLNVVVYRLPIMMERAWRRECRAFLQLPEAREETQEPFNLMVPGSHCLHCRHAVRPYENIPVLSYLVLRGRCSQCGESISIRYPLLEAFTALISVLTVWRFGYSLETVFALILSWSLIALSMIDFDHQLLPDSITLPLLWLGLLLSLFGFFTDSRSSILGVAAGYLSLWSIYHLFKLATGKEGMGFGDFKMLAMLGAWMGWQMLPLIILLSSVVGAVIGTLLAVFLKRGGNTPIPFGPYLAAAGWIALLFGDDLTQLYLNYAGLSR